VYLRVGPPLIRVDARLWRVATGQNRGQRAAMTFRSEHDTEVGVAHRIGSALGQCYDRFGWSAKSRPPVAVPALVDLGGEVLIDFDYVDDRDMFHRLLDRLVNRLTEAGLVGLLLCAQPMPPQETLPLMPANVMVAGLALPTVMDAAGRPPAQTGWFTDDGLTDRLLTFGLDWIHPTGPTVFVEVNGRPRPVPLAHAAALVKDRLYPLTQASVFAFNDTGYRRITLSDHGHVNLEIAECNEAWQPAVSELTQVLRDWAADVRYGLVRRSQGPGPGWSITIGTVPPAPQVFASYTVIAPGLEDRLIPDPYGVQLVNGRHLANISPPASWVVELVATDRYLLSAPTPEDWFGIGRPHRATLESTRQQFINALIRDDDVDRTRHDNSN
jgi:hypothetical protein